MQTPHDDGTGTAAETRSGTAAEIHAHEDANRRRQEEERAEEFLGRG